MGKIEVKDIKTLFKKCIIPKDKFLGCEQYSVDLLYRRGDIVDAFECKDFSLTKEFYDYIGYSNILGYNAHILNIIKSSLIELIDSLPIDSEGFVDLSSLNCDKKTESMLAILAMKCMLIKPILFGAFVKYKRTREKDGLITYDIQANVNFDVVDNPEAFNRINNDIRAVQ